ncbi:MAG: uridine kinase family protein [Saccharofermentanales bacterium]|jgi:uridine kinase|nr:hypothetical protein [Bacillota bacterium]NLB08571.1 hypothetical protein [Clostridiales bacterium]
MAELSKLIELSVEDLEGNLGSTRLQQFVAESEEDFAGQVKAVADRVIEKEQVRVFFISGPTSSGKTTFSTHFTKLLSAAGRKTYLLSMDDYYKTEDVSYDEDGRPDLESIETLDMDLMLEDILKFDRGQEVVLPTFLFKTRERVFEPEKVIRPEAGDVLVIEGLHGLSTEIINHLPPEKSLGLFIMPHGRVHSDARMLSGSDIRMLRRISRDVRQRGSSALATIDYWPMIDRAEQDFIPGYLAAADYYINTILPYEFMVTATLARDQIHASLDGLLKGTLPPSKNTINPAGWSDLPRAVKKAVQLAEACANLPSVNPNVVPADSILQEFI